MCENLGGGTSAIGTVSGGDGERVRQPLPGHKRATHRGLLWSSSVANGDEKGPPKGSLTCTFPEISWWALRDSNPRPQPCEGCAPGLSDLRVRAGNHSWPACLPSCIFPQFARVSNLYRSRIGPRRHRRAPAAALARVRTRLQGGSGRADRSRGSWPKRRHSGW